MRGDCNAPAAHDVKASAAVTPHAAAETRAAPTPAIGADAAPTPAGSPEINLRRE